MRTDNAMLSGFVATIFGFKFLYFLIPALIWTFSFGLIACDLPAEAQLVASITHGQAPLSVSFTNQSSNADQFHWDFGDGTTMSTSSKKEFVIHQYTKTGNHTVTLTAIKRGEPIETSTAFLNINVKPGSPHNVILTTEQVEVAAGQKIQLTALVSDAFDNPIPDVSLNWDVSDTVGSITSNGTFLATTQSGIFNRGITVTALSGVDSIQSTFPVIIKPGPLQQVRIDRKIEIQVGKQTQLSAVAEDAYGNPIPEAQIEWRVSSEAGQISRYGIFTPKTKPGTFENAITVTARLDGNTANATAQLVLYRGPLADIRLSPSMRFGYGESRQLTAVATDKYNNPISEANLTWEATSGAGTITSDGIFTAADYTEDPTSVVTVTAKVDDLSYSATSSVSLHIVSDLNLETAIREVISKPEGDINVSDLETLTTLSAGKRNIQYFTGLEYCTNLQKLYLSVWNFHHDVSDLSPLANLVKLETLFIYFANIRDISPLANLTNLRNLNLPFNYEITDISALIRLINLDHVELHYNSINDISGLAGLTKVFHLSLGSNEISDLSALSGLVNLNTLHLYSNNITDISPLAGCLNLRIVTLGGNIIRDVTALGGLRNLHTISLSSNKITDISALSLLTNLIYFDINDNEITDITPLSRMTKLKELEIANNMITDISPLISLPNLEKVDLTGNPLSSESLEVYIPQLEARGVTVIR